MTATTAVPLSDPMFDHLAEKVLASHPRACIVSIERISSPAADDRFAARRAATGAEVLALFHGTSSTCVRHIVDNGFKAHLNRVSAHGHGTYFARQASFSFAFMKDVDPGGLSHMFYCDVLLTPSTTSAAKGGIFVVPNDADCVPRFVISFHKAAVY
jgi:hypothetical protein